MPVFPVVTVSGVSANGATVNVAGYGAGSYSSDGGYTTCSWTVTLPGGAVGPCEAEILLRPANGYGLVLGSVAMWEVAASFTG